MITIELEPQEFQSAYNEVIMVLDSTNKAEDKFQYVVDINIDGVYSSRLKIQSNPQGYGVVDISKHLASRIDKNIIDFTERDLFQRIQDNFIKYDVTLSEEYVLGTSFTGVNNVGGFTQYVYASDHNFIEGDFVTVSNCTNPTYDGVQEVTSATATTITTTRAFSLTGGTGDSILSNGTTTIIPSATVFSEDKYATTNVVDWVDYPSWDATDYIVDGADPAKFMTNLPTSFTVKLNGRYSFNIYNKTTDEARYLKVSSDNNGTYFYDNVFTASTDSSKFLSVGVGPYDIINAPKSGSVPVPGIPIDGDTKSYTIELMDASFNSSSEMYYFTIDRSSTSHENYQLLYLNKGGSYSTFNFSAAHEKSVKAKKTSFKQNYGSYDSSANTYGWNSHDRGSTRLDTVIDEVYSLNSDYVTEAVGNTIEDLIISPEVYHITASTYEFTGAVSISAVTDDGNGKVQVNAVAHDVYVGDTIKMSGVNGYAGEYVVDSVIDVDNFVLCHAFTTTPFIGSSTYAKKTLSADGTLRAIDIKTNRVKLKQRATDKLINYSIQFEYSNKNRVQ